MFLLVLLTGALPLPAAAQAPPADDNPSERIAARLDFLASAEGAITQDAEAATAAWTAALNAVRELESLSQQRADFESRTAAAPGELELVKKELEQLAASPSPAVETDATLEQAIARQTAVAAELKAARTLFEELTTTQTRQRERSTQIPDQIARIRAELAGLTAPEQPPATAGELPRGRYEQSLQEQRALAGQIRKLEAEAAHNEATEELLAAQIDRATRRAASLAQQDENWRELVEKRRGEAAEAASKTAKSQERAFASIPELQEFAAATAALAQRRTGPEGLVASIARVSRERQQLLAELAEIEEERRNSERRVALLVSAGMEMDPAIAELLSRQKQSLETPVDLRVSLRRDLQTRLRLSANAEIDLLELNTQARDEATGFEAILSGLLAAAERSQESDIEEADVGRLVENRRQVLNELIRDYGTYVRALHETNEVTKRAIDEVTGYERFLDERLLWVPSTGRLEAGDFRKEALAVRALFRETLVPWVGELQRSLRQSWPAWALFAMVPGALLARRRMMLASLDRCGETAARRNCTVFKPTGEAALLSLLLAAPWPVLFLWLSKVDSGGPVASGLRHAAWLTLFVGFLLVCCRPTGLLEAHFRLEPERISHLSRQLRWFLPAMLPVIFLAGALFAADRMSGRLSFIVTTLLAAALMLQLLAPRHGWVHHGGRPSRLARLWFAIGLLIPIGLTVAAAQGYFTSAQTLRTLAVQSLCIMTALWFVNRLLLRWTLVSRRRLAIEQAMRRREAIMAEREKARENDGGGGGGGKAGDVPSLEEVKAAAVNVVEVEEQTARLTRALTFTVLAFGLWAIWAPTLPALSMLDQVNLWRGQATAPATPPAPVLPGITGAAGGAASQAAADSSGSMTETLPALIRPSNGGVSAQDVLVAIVALFLTFVGAKNIPGLLELSLLRRMDLKPGGSFAVTTTIRYFIILAGILTAFGKIGITWSKVQWIAAAVTVGIGFGLQEVFANFVAGLILLFERPIRLGDTVTIGNASGKVTQIRIRATTILQFNNRELIVPNKELITGTLVNWTLTDSVLRLEIPVGIAYGSDTEKARSLLLEAARANPRILKEPAPDVLFSAFGDSALSFELRAHVGSIENLLPARNELSFAVDRAFRDAGIEIAFPQTDIHIRSLPEGVALAAGKPQAQSAASAATASSSDASS